MYAQVTSKTVSIEPTMSFQNYEHFKRLTLDSPDSHIEYLDGFDFEWGYTYKLKVKQTKLNSTLSDGTQYEYTYEKTISKTPAPDSATFTMILDPHRYYYQVDSSELEADKTIHRINDSTYLYFDKVEIEVPNHFRESFELIYEGKKTELGHFKFVGARRIRLINLGR